jgi:hypothetical protein
MLSADCEAPWVICAEGLLIGEPHVKVRIKAESAEGKRVTIWAGTGFGSTVLEFNLVPSSRNGSQSFDVDARATATWDVVVDGVSSEVMRIQSGHFQTSISPPDKALFYLVVTASEALSFPKTTPFPILGMFEFN